MPSYREGIFRNDFETRIFIEARDTCEWCMQFAQKDYAIPVVASVFHNVQTRDFHGVLSNIDTFARPQSREIDILPESYEPKKTRLLISCKDFATQVKVEQVGDLEALLNAMRLSAQNWLYWAMVVGRHGFQAGCEETAKRADIALVPPITGNVAWLKYLTFEEVAERVEDAIKVFLLGEIFWLDASSYTNGNFYNGVFVSTRESSGMPGETKIRKADGSETPMKAFIDAAITKNANKYRIPLSRGRTYIPLFDPPILQSLDKDGQLAHSPVRSIIAGPPTTITFFKVKTIKGRQLIADGQRAVYVMDAHGSHRRLVRVDKLKVGTKIIGVSEDEATTELDEVLEVHPC